MGTLNRSVNLGLRSLAIVLMTHPQSLLAGTVDNKSVVELSMQGHHLSHWLDNSYRYIKSGRPSGAAAARRAARRRRQMKARSPK